MHFAMTTRANVLVLMLSFFTLVSASVAMKRSALDVYAPQITYPTTGTVWKAKSRQNVTWDVSDPPKQITNRNSQIRLVYKDMITPLLLADGFDVMIGSIVIDVPWVVEGDYSLVLIGDSGNDSQTFSIVAPEAVQV